VSAVPQVSAVVLSADLGDRHRLLDPEGTPEGLKQFVHDLVDTLALAVCVIPIPFPSRMLKKYF